MIYFIHALGTGFVKIGRCKDSPARRMKSHQIGCPHELRLVATCDGNAKTERALHERFAKSHERGEWFRLDQELVDFIESAGLSVSDDCERIDITIKQVDIEVWKAARLAQLEDGVTMAQWIEDAIRNQLERRRS